MSGHALYDMDDAEEAINIPPLLGDTMVLWYDYDPRDGQLTASEELRFADMDAEMQCGVEWSPRQGRYTGSWPY